MSNMPKLTEKQVERFLGSRTFASDRAFARAGSLDNARAEGLSLKADFEGSMPYPYRAEVVLGPDGVVSINCNCSGHKYGPCKHVAAILFTWLDQPEQFRTVQSIDSMLAQLDRDGLVALIHKMLDRAPELEALFELPLPGMNKNVLVKVGTIRAQIANALNSAPRHEWRASSVVARELENLLDTADEYLDNEAWQNAMIIFETMARDVLEEYETFNDHEGEFHGIVSSCIEGLGKCLSGFGKSEKALRLQIMRALFDTFMWDVDFGGIDMGVDAPDVISREGSGEEKDKVTEWLLAATNEDERGDWLNGIIFDLQAHKMNDEEYLDYCRRARRFNSLIERLLVLGRVDEATNEARLVHDRTLISLNGLFTEHNQPNLVEQIARERLPENRSRILLEWLLKLAQKRENKQEILQFREQLFWVDASLERYTDIKEAAIQVGIWSDLRGPLMSRLTKASKHDLITEIHVVEKEIKNALNTLRKTRSSWGYSDLATKVARAAETTHPHDAINIYLSLSTSLIDKRGRGNYAIAAQHLIRIRDIYLKMNDPAAWQKVISRVRADNTRLTALADEMRKARV